MSTKLIPIFFFILSPSLSSCHTAQLAEDINVISLSREIDKNVSGYELCSSFTLTKENIATYFSVAEEVDEYEFNVESIILPCKYTGLIKINDITFNWEIFAGGAGYLYNQSLSKRYLCKQECCAILTSLC